MWSGGTLSGNDDEQPGRGLQSNVRLLYNEPDHSERPHVCRIRRDQWKLYVVGGGNPQLDQSESTHRKLGATMLSDDWPPHPFQSLFVVPIFIRCRFVIDILVFTF